MQYQSLLFSKFEQISANVVFATLLLYFGYPRKSIFSSSVSYSNGYLLESTSTKIIEGIPGVGFKLTTDGNYDMENKKKLTNLKPGTNDSDALTNKQIYDHVKANGGDSSSPSIDLTDY